MNRLHSQFPVDVSALDISKEHFDKFTEELERYAESCIKDNLTAPTLILYYRTVTETGLSDITTDVIVMPDADFNDPENKKKIMQALGSKVHLQKQLPVAIFLMSEAWLSTQKQDNQQIPPSEDPNREEVVIVAGQTGMRDEHVLIVYPVQREKNRLVWGGKKTKHSGACDALLLNQFWRGYFAMMIAKYPELAHKLRNL